MTDETIDGDAFALPEVVDCSAIKRGFLQTLGDAIYRYWVAVKTPASEDEKIDLHVW